MKETGDCTITIARHGESDFNLDNRVQDPIKPHLTELGHQQALTTKNELEKLGINFNLIICSDMTRNIETLVDIYPSYKNLDNIKIDPRLQERFHKDLAGKTKFEIQKEIGKDFTDRFSWELYFEGTNKSILTSQNYVNDESLESVKKRVMSLISEIKNKNSVLLIGSSIFNQYILEYLFTKTVGENKPALTSGEILDFQKNNELRIVTVDENTKVKNYSSIKY